LACAEQRIQRLLKSHEIDSPELHNSLGDLHLTAQPAGNGYGSFFGTPKSGHSECPLWVESGHSLKGPVRAVNLDNRLVFVHSLF
jgi:hypothetical protein